MSLQPGSPADAAARSARQAAAIAGFAHAYQFDVTYSIRGRVRHGIAGCASGGTERGASCRHYDRGIL